MYYQDFSPFQYHSFDPWPNVLNIGWLDKDFEYTKGDVSAGFLEKLLIYCQYPVFLFMGYHECDMCRETPHPIKLPNSSYSVFGSAEIRVFGKDGVVYASPNMIYHYVFHHNYLPPEEFIRTVIESDLSYQLRMYREVYDEFM